MRAARVGDLLIELERQHAGGAGARFPIERLAADEPPLFDGEIAQPARGQPMALGIGGAIGASVGDGGAGDVAAAAAQIAEPVERPRGRGGTGRVVGETLELGHRLRLGPSDEALAQLGQARRRPRFVEHQRQRRDQEREQRRLRAAVPRTASTPAAIAASGQRPRRGGGIALQPPPSISG